MTAAEQLNELARSFPSLCDALCLYRKRTKDRTADVDNTAAVLVYLVKFGKLGSGASHAARFCLAIWNGRTQEDELLRFELPRAVATWDGSHRAAFARWAQEPVLL